MMMTNRHLVQILKVAKLMMSTIKMENQTTCGDCHLGEELFPG